MADHDEELLVVIFLCKQQFLADASNDGFGFFCGGPLD